MTKKIKKVEEVPEHIQRFKKIYDRYQRNYIIIVFLWLAIVVAIWYFTGWFWSITVFIFGLGSLWAYENGAQENCIDEYEFAYPKDGFRRMFKSWPWFVGIAIIAYFFCDAYMPWLFEVQ